MLNGLRARTSDASACVWNDVHRVRRTNASAWRLLKSCVDDDVTGLGRWRWGIKRLRIGFWEHDAIGRVSRHEQFASHFCNTKLPELSEVSRRAYVHVICQQLQYDRVPSFGIRGCMGDPCSLPNAKHLRPSIEDNMVLLCSKLAAQDAARKDAKKRKVRWTAWRLALHV